MAIKQIRQDHWSLAFGVTWENEQTASCYAHTSSVHQLACILLLLRQVPSVQACVEPGAKSCTDYVTLRLFICLQANWFKSCKTVCHFRWLGTKPVPIRLFECFIFSKKSVELMAINQIIKKYCISE